MTTRRNQNFSPAQAHEAFRSDYQAARASRFRRIRTGLVLSGSGADYHYRNESSYLKVIEYSRDMDRNDAIIGSTLDLSTTNIVQGGFTLDVNTGDKSIDADLAPRWKDWSEDPRQCDASGELTFPEIEWLTQRAVSLDGDIFSLALQEGALRMVEAHRARTPSGTKRNVVNGILLDDARRRKQVWFTKDDIDPLSSLRNVSDVEPYDIYDRDGYRQIFHIYDPKRFSQTRGISALAPIFDVAGMFDDINFATMLKQQVNNCITIFFEMAKDGLIQLNTQQMGEIVSERLSDNSTRTIEGWSPGTVIKGLPGESLKGYSPNIPNPEWFQHMKFLLQIIGVNLGLPLVIVLLDAKETNFSGWRGAVDQARMGWRRKQNALKAKFHSQVYPWKVRQWISEDRALAAAAKRMGKKIFGHNWNTPQWPYIEPKKDAEADALRIEKLLTSPRRLHAERGREYGEVVTETIADNKALIESALVAADDLNSRFNNAGLTWRDLVAPIGSEPPKVVAQPDEPESEPAKKGMDNDE